MTELTRTGKNTVLASSATRRCTPRATGLLDGETDNPATATTFFKSAFNSKNGKWIIHPYPAHRYACRSLSETSLAWVIGQSTNAALRHHLATQINNSLIRFVQGEDSSGVIVLEREWEANGWFFHSANATWMGIKSEPSNYALLIPTDIVSTRNGETIYLRVDLSSPEKPNGVPDATTFLFTDDVGHSIAGFGAMPIRVEGITDFRFSLNDALGHELDDAAFVLVNGAIFEAWLNHVLGDSDADAVTIRLPVRAANGDEMTLILRRVLTSAWHIFIVIDGEECDLAHFAPATCIVVDNHAVDRDVDKLVKAFTSCSDSLTLAAINYEHIFGDEEHLGRFSDSFRAELETDPAKAIAKFEGEVLRASERLRHDHTAWNPILFHDGREKDLDLNGASIMTRVQLAAPLCLTDADRERGLASVYIVATIMRRNDSVEVCWFPTILDPTTAAKNTKLLIRAIHNTIRLAA